MTENALACPSCDAKGRKVKTLTVLAQLRRAAPEIESASAFRFCRTSSCEVVYFDNSHQQRFSTADLEVTVFQKRQDPSCLACYCFDHSVAALEEEVERTGGSIVPASIAADCKAGLDDCERNNPQGSCCLGNVRKVIKLAVEARGGGVQAELKPSACCCTEKA